MEIYSSVLSAMKGIVLWAHQHSQLRSKPPQQRDDLKKERKEMKLFIDYFPTNKHAEPNVWCFFLGLWLLTHGELGRGTWRWHCTHSLAELANACTISIDRFSIKGEGGRVSLMSGSWHTALGGFCISKALIYSDSLALCFPCLFHLSYVLLQVWGHVHIYVCLSW